MELLRAFRNIYFYYTNTNEIQGELSRENMIFTCENNMLSSHVKRSPLLWLHNKSRLSQEKCLTEMVLYFIGVYIINRTLHSRLEIRNFSSSVEKYFTSERSERVKYLQHEERNFVSPHGHVISSMCYIFCHKTLGIDTLKMNYSKPSKLT